MRHKIGAEHHHHRVRRPSGSLRPTAMPSVSEPSLPSGGGWSPRGVRRQLEAPDFGAAWSGPSFGRPSSPLTSKAAADRFMVNQLGGTQYNDATHAKGTRDCGPSSAVMALAKLGLVPAPTADSAESQIVDLRDAMHGAGAKTQNTNWDQEAHGLRARGAHTRILPRDLGAVDSALAAGHPVVIGGDPSRAWEGRLQHEGGYQERGHFDHFCVLMGKTPEGRYILCDPLSKSGAVTVSASDVRNYWSDPRFHGAMEVARGS
jgi:hypothetical protein